MYELEKAKSGDRTLKYNNKYIHSKYNPQKEAESFAKGNFETIKKDVSVIYGIGLGYHIKEISKILDEKCTLYVFEYNTELIKYCKMVTPEIFNMTNIKIIDGSQKEFYRLLSEKIMDVEDIIVHRPSLETIFNKNENLYNLISDFNNVKQLSRLDTVNLKVSEENIIHNRLKCYDSINKLLDYLKQDNRPCLIVSSGPSLDSQMDILSKNKEKFLIICVGSSLKTLINNDIKPDVIVIIDPKEIVKKQFEGVEDLNVPLCFPSSASKWAIDYYRGGKFIFDRNDDEEIIEVTGTVAISAIDIAIKSGAKEIILIGQDLAYIGDRSHTSTYKDVYGFADKEKETRKIKNVKSVYNEMIETNNGYMIFKRKIEQLISSHKDINFINASKGAFIEGTVFIEFDKLCNDL